MATHYETLEVEPSADLDTIKSSYRKIVKTCHPDRVQGEEAKAKFQIVTHAYDILSDSGKRTMYDRLGHERYENMFGSPNNSAKGSKDQQKAEETLQKFFDASGKMVSDLNKPGTLKQKFISTLKTANNIAKAPIIAVPVVLIGTFNSFNALGEVYSGFERAGATGIAAVLSYAALRATPAGAAVLGCTARVLIGNTARLATVFMKATSKETKNVLIASSIGLAHLGAANYGMVKTYDLLKDAGMEAIKHPESVPKYWGEGRTAVENVFRSIRPS